MRWGLQCFESHIFPSLQQLPTLIFLYSLMCRFVPLLSYHNTMVRKVTQFFSNIIDLLYLNRDKESYFWFSEIRRHPGHFLCDSWEARNTFLVKSRRAALDPRFQAAGALELCDVAALSCLCDDALFSRGP